MVVAQLRALVPGQRAPQRCREVLEDRRDLVAQAVRARRRIEVNQHREPLGAFYERARYIGPYAFTRK